MISPTKFHHKNRPKNIFFLFFNAQTNFEPSLYQRRVEAPSPESDFFFLTFFLFIFQSTMLTKRLIFTTSLCICLTFARQFVNSDFTDTNETDFDYTEVLKSTNSKNIIQLEFIPHSLNAATLPEAKGIPVGDFYDLVVMISMPKLNSDVIYDVKFTLECEHVDLCNVYWIWGMKFQIFYF